MSDTKFKDVLADYRRRAEAEAGFLANASPADVRARADDLLLHVGESEAELLRVLAIANGSKFIVELGTSLGFSTLFLADAARLTGGRVFTFEFSEAKQAFAREQIARAGLGAFVDWRLGDALSLLHDLESGVDFVFIDLWKDLYKPALEAIAPKLAPKAVIAADNMLYPEFARPDAEAYRAAVKTLPNFHSTLLPIGHGIELSVRSPP